MIDNVIPALECGHRCFKLVRFAGKGYEGHCYDCKINGVISPIPGTAMNNFERAVKKAQAIERREAKKLADKACA